MSAQNFGRALCSKELRLPYTGAVSQRAFFIKDHGFAFGWGTTADADAVYASGALFFDIDSANLYYNSAITSGEAGTVPSWKLALDV